MNQTQFHAQKSTSSEHSTFEKVKRLIDFKNGSKLSVLDVGCGNGVLDQELASFGHLITGLDVHPLPGEPLNWKFIETDINSEWPVAEQSQDVVICTDVPEHMYDPAHVMVQARRVLREDGKLIFGVPNHFDLRQRLRTLFGKGIVHWDTVKYDETAWDYAHIRFFIHSELVAKFKAYEWHVEKIQFNFMGAGIVPTWLLPNFIKNLLLKLWPGLWSGKFIYLLSKKPVQQTKQINLPYTSAGY